MIKQRSLEEGLFEARNVIRGICLSKILNFQHIAKTDDVKQQGCAASKLATIFFIIVLILCLTICLLLEALLNHKPNCLYFKYSYFFLLGIEKISVNS